MFDKMLYNSNVVVASRYVDTDNTISWMRGNRTLICNFGDRRVAITLPYHNKTALTITESQLNGHVY